MKTKFAALLAMLLALTLMVSAFACAEAVPGAVVTENPEAKTGYTATFTYVDKFATNVQITGTFYFYVENDEKLYGQNYNLGENEKYLDYAIPSTQWEKGKNLCHVFDEQCVYDMENVGEGTWTLSLDLPAGYYNYKYKVSYNDGKSYQTIIDPANRARLASMNMTERRSEIYVPFNAELHDPWLDATYATAVENAEDAGARRHFTYAGVDGEVRPGMIYLPAGYDPDRVEPYKVLYACHGSQGDELDFFLQWHGDYITDRAIAEGIVEPFIVVTMNNKLIGKDYDKKYDNLVNYLIPYIEEHYNVSREPKDRAYCGLSMGGMTTCHTLCQNPDYFGYYGMFSGSLVESLPEQEDYTAFNNAHIYLGTSWCDFLYVSQRMPLQSIVAIAEKLDEKGIAYNNGDGIKVVNGGHDWYTWDQLLRDFYETTLWK